VIVKAAGAFDVERRGGAALSGPEHADLVDHRAIGVHQVRVRLRLVRPGVLIDETNLIAKRDTELLGIDRSIRAYRDYSDGAGWAGRRRWWIRVPPVTSSAARAQYQYEDRECTPESAQLHWTLLPCELIQEANEVPWGACAKC
jgi:hypothetical protein